MRITNNGLQQLAAIFFFLTVYEIEYKVLSAMVCSHPIFTNMSRQTAPKLSRIIPLGPSAQLWKWKLASPVPNLIKLFNNRPKIHLLFPGLQIPARRWGPGTIYTLHDSRYTSVACSPLLKAIETSTAPIYIKRFFLLHLHCDTLDSWIERYIVVAIGNWGALEREGLRTRANEMLKGRSLSLALML